MIISNQIEDSDIRADTYVIGVVIELVTSIISSILFCLFSLNLINLYYGDIILYSVNMR